MQISEEELSSSDSDESLDSSNSSLDSLAKSKLMFEREWNHLEHHENDSLSAEIASYKNR